LPITLHGGLQPRQEESSEVQAGAQQRRSIGYVQQRLKVRVFNLTGR